MGIASSTYNYPGFSLIHPNDGYVVVYGNTTTRGGNLILAAGGGDQPETDDCRCENSTGSAGRGCPTQLVSPLCVADAVCRTDRL